MLSECQGTESVGSVFITYFTTSLKAHAFKVGAGRVHSVQEVPKERTVLLGQRGEVHGVDIRSEVGVRDIFAD